MSGPGAGARRSRALTFSLSGPGALRVGTRRSLCRILCRGPAASVSGPLCVSGPGALFVRARRSPALSVSGPALHVGPGAVCVGLCGGLRRPVCQGPTGSCAPAISFSGPGSRALFVSGPGPLCIGTGIWLSRRSLCRPGRLGPGTFSHSVSGPRATTHPIRRPPAPIRVPPIRSAGPQLRSACHPSKWRVPCVQERTPNLTAWGKILKNFTKSIINFETQRYIAKSYVFRTFLQNKTIAIFSSFGHIAKKRIFSTQSLNSVKK